MIRKGIILELDIGMKIACKRKSQSGFKERSQIALTVKCLVRIDSIWKEWMLAVR